MTKRLGKDFYENKTLKVAQNLLGKFLVRKIGNRVIAAKIIETEAYCGPKDRASHASRGRTERTKIMFGPAGQAYVYLIYGMYYCLNVVTEKDGYPAAVLIRALEYSKADGPGKLCRELKIDKKLNAVNLTKNDKLWLEDRGEVIKPSQIERSPRIGVDYAGEWKDKPWRFVIKSN